VPTVGVSDLGVPGPTSEIVVACPCLDGLARNGTQEVGQVLYYPAPGVPLVVGVTSTSREKEKEREGACSFAPSPTRTPLQDGPGPPFYRRKERIRTYNGGCSYALTCPAEKCLSLVYMPTWLSGESLSPVHMIAWLSEKHVEAQLAARQGSC
jgi:hypothetical protein